MVDSERKRRRASLRSDNRVIVRVWSSAFSGGEGVGHVSIEIPDRGEYMSLWPQETAKHIFVSMPYKLMLNFQEDLTAERRLPEKTICLYGLEIEYLVGKFKEFQKELRGWRGIGSNALSWEEKSRYESCASFALKILQAGGIQGWAQVGSSFSSSVTPDGTGSLVEEAKAKELIKYPETATFQFRQMVYFWSAAHNAMREMEEKEWMPAPVAKVSCAIL